jgi:hypothetical protein
MKVESPGDALEISLAELIGFMLALEIVKDEKTLLKIILCLPLFYSTHQLLMDICMR